MDKPFRYETHCTAPGCDRPARYKIAATWSDGTRSELKNYGLACEVHRDTQLMRARAQREGLHLFEGETVGPVGLYPLVPGKRDVELIRMAD